MTRHTRILIAGVVLILFGNAVALIGVAYNRSGEPDAVVELSERELTSPYGFRASKENSGLTLRLNWRADVDPESLSSSIKFAGGDTLWLNEDKLAELGFDINVSPKDPDAERRHEKTLPRKAYVVLEFNGPAYQAVLQRRRADVDEAQDLLATNPGKKEIVKRVKTYKAMMDSEQFQRSRLFVIDAGLDQADLRGRYPDRARYLILPGQARLTVINKELAGYISDIDASTVNVPLAYRDAISGGPIPARYSVRLAFGQRAEPWIMEAQAGRDGQNGSTD